jgi:Fe-S-cluster containining protein
LGKPYYESAGGLGFRCTRCGNCCTRPGPVYFSGGDLARAADFLGLSEDAFWLEYGLVEEDGVPALDPPGDGPCPFYDPAQGCSIYAARPTQCRTWPFWPEVVHRRRSWEKAARDCPGMDRGPVHPPQAIERYLLACEEAGLPEGDPW